jgi:hypothetical protein
MVMSYAGWAEAVHRLAKPRELPDSGLPEEDRITLCGRRIPYPSQIRGRSKEVGYWSGFNEAHARFCKRCRAVTPKVQPRDNHG